MQKNSMMADKKAYDLKVCIENHSKPNFGYQEVNYDDDQKLKIASVS